VLLVDGRLPTQELLGPNYFLFRRRVVNSNIQDNQTKEKLLKKLKNTFTLSLLIASASYSNFGYAATTYYVDAAAGNDSYPGTSASPLKTIQKAAYIINPGDTVVVKDGIYTTTDSALVDISYGGSVGKPVTFIAEHPAGAKLDGNSNHTNHGWVIEPGVAYVNIQGFEISGFGASGFMTSGASNIGIIGNHIHDIGHVCSNSDLGLVGMFFGKSSSISITNNIIHDIGRFAPGEKGCKPTNANYQNHDHGIYLNGVSNLTINSNTFYSITRGWGIQVYSGSGVLSTGIKILNNAFSYPNPYRDGHIVFAYPGLTQSSVNNNKFYQPTGQALNFNKGIILSSVSVTTNRTDSAVISKVSPSGVTLSGNMTVP
jgi:Right handed beta helix region/Protein of unknown function (DUF1565)